MDGQMQSFEIQNAVIDTFSMLWAIKKAQPDGVENPVLNQEIKKVIVKLETFGINIEGLK